ncbi:Hypothetical predicted protein [Paramuricea clavata]|uniref:Uncharacterized protein n=1 Tax=Paramuricea clavata TaxID=317549 RepID=A0A6S7GXA3_PARCT|nr:Hypothetical predicted protein [Paramuricea clavata]
MNISNDSPIPLGFVSDVPTTLAWENDDFSEETRSSKGTTHITEGIIIQREQSTSTLLQRRDIRSRSLPADIRKTVNLNDAMQNKEIEEEHHILPQIDAKKNDLAFCLCRYLAHFPLQTYQDPNPTLIPDMTEIDEEALLAGDNSDNYNENFTMNNSLEIDELCLYDMEDKATNEHEQNTGSPDTDKQHINEPSIEQNITEQCMDRPNTDEVDMDITEEANNNDANSHQNSSTNQHQSHNKDNMHNHTHNSIDFIDVPKHLLTSFMDLKYDTTNYLQTWKTYKNTGKQIHYLLA